MARRAPSTPPTPDALDERKARILRTVVVEHIDTAQPVGSSSVAQAADLDVSPATVRTEMVSLEREGYLAQPHTSAGRVPTDKGYRFFVDHLDGGVLGRPQIHQISEFFRHVRGEVEDVLEQASTLLTQLTNYTAVVVGEGHSHASIISANLVNLDAHHNIFVVVYSDGAVTKSTLITEYEATNVDVAEASRQLGALLLGTTVSQTIQVPSRDDTVSRLVRESVALLHAESPTVSGEKVFIEGSSRVASSFDGVETVRQVLSILEQELLVVSLVEDVLKDGVSVAIGSEHGYEELSSCAVVVAPVTVEGARVGSVGLLGPTRMKYPEVLAAARVVSEELGRHFSGEAPR